MVPFRNNLLVVLVTASTGIPVSAQVSGAPANEAVFREAFENDSSAALPQCDVTPVRPELDFSLRFQAGFSMSLPPGEYGGPHHYGVLLLRITPEHEQAAYVLDRVDLSDKSKTNLAAHIRGNFVVLEGNYSVEILFGDEQRKLCRSQWRIDTKLARNQRLLPATSAPGAAALGRLTVLMQVAPSSPRAAKLREADLRKLLGTLSALLEQSPGRAARLVVFNLEQQKVLFRKDEFTQADFQNLAKLIDERPSGVVDYAALENSRGEADMLTRLIETERCELGASDALVFLGLHMQQPASIRSGTVKRLEKGPRVFYLECEQPSLPAPNTSGGISAESATLPPAMPETLDPSNRDRFPALAESQEQPDPATSLSPGAVPDIIQQLVKQLKGETIPIRKPDDCARAIRRIALSGKRPGAGGTTTTPEQRIDLTVSSSH